uniref:Uncharacterized protein n=1 Tax=Ditylenchus dipsaci TaxID=166011 RepID=A0A915DER3_9BILA
MPPKNNVTSSDDSLREVATLLSPNKIQKKPSVENDKPSSSPAKSLSKKDAIVNHPSCSFENSDSGANRNSKKGSKFTSEKQLDSTPVHGRRIDVGELLKSSLQAKDNPVVEITAKIMYTHDDSHEFCGCLISIDCEEEGYLQGEVISVDSSQRTITLGKPLKDGCPMGVDSLVVLPTSIRELKILKMPPKKNLNSSDDSQKGVAETSSTRTQKGQVWEVQRVSAFQLNLLLGKILQWIARLALLKKNFLVLMGIEEGG